MIPLNEDDMFLLDKTATIAAAYFSGPSGAGLPIASVATVIAAIMQTLQGFRPVASVDPQAAHVVVMPTPAVPVKKSITPHHLVCLDCGLEVQMLKRHIQVHHGLSPDGYREKWGLLRDYPMVSSDYSARRSALAKDIGLGKRAA